MDSRKYSMYRFFSIPGDAFILCIGFFTDSGRCFLRPKLSILYSMYPIMIIYIYITICLIIYTLIYFNIYIYSWSTAFSRPWCFVHIGGWGGVGHVLKFMWACGVSTVFPVFAGMCVHTWVGWGGVGHVLAFMWTCGVSTVFSVFAGMCVHTWVGWGGVGHVLTFMWTCGVSTVFSVFAGMCVHAWGEVGWGMY